MKKIKITCKGQKYISINKLKDFQGNLKELGEEEFKKLKQAILNYGFSFPVFVWQNNILDGHQRLFIVRKLLEEGYTIDKIPVVEIEAANEQEAAEKLLLLNSCFGKISDEGLYKFIYEHDVDIDKLLLQLSIPDFDFENFYNTYFVDEVLDKNKENEKRQEEKEEKKKKNFIQCPKCGFKWEK